MSEWIRIGASSDFDEGIKLIDIGRRKIAITRLGGQLFAFNGLCPHAGGPMHRSETEGSVITCPLHGWRFNLLDGGKELHNYRALSVYEIRSENGEVSVRI